MISIFNGRRRSLGDAQASVFAQLSVEFRQYLHHFKGARLHVFLCVSLHADEKGWAYPTIEACIKRETGYNRETIINALNELCQLSIEGHRVLLAYQPINPDGTFQPNQYLIFPTPEEIATYETNNSRRRQPRDARDARDAKAPAEPSAENPDSVKPSSKKPNSVKPNSEKPNSKKNQPKAEPSEEEPIQTDDDNDAPWARRIIHEVLSGRGVDDPVPHQIAAKLGDRMDGVEITMYAVQRVENNAAARVDAQHEYGAGVEAAAQRLSDIETAANGLLIHRLRNKSKDTPAKMLRTIQAARSVGIDAWLIGAGVDAVMVSLWREEQDAALVRHGLDPVAQSQPAKTAGNRSPTTVSASNGHNRSTEAATPAPAPTTEPTGKHVAAWNYTRNALELEHGRGTYAKWLNMAKLTAAQGSHFVISMPSSYAGDWFAQRIVPDLKIGLAERLGVAPEATAVTVAVNE